MHSKCELVERSSQPVLSVRTRTPVQGLQAALGKAYASIMTYMAGTGQQPSGAPFVAYYNMNMADLDVEIGFPVAVELPGQGDVQSGFIPAGKYAACLFTGPYSELAEPYTALNEWMDLQRLEPTGVVYEQYLNDPTVTPPEQLQTYILFQVKAPLPIEQA
jgi:effector-binding domain-containing protein